jgi:hypothetical protein
MSARLSFSLAVAVVAATLAQAAAKDEPFLKIHEGRHWIGIARQDQYEKQKADIEALYDYADTAFDTLCKDWGMKPPKPKYVLLVNPQPGGGFAGGDIGEAHAFVGNGDCPGIGCSYDAFSGTAHHIKAYWAHILITHEMVNLFTGQIVSGGWPVDWWADHRSPFPYMTAVSVETELVPDMGVWHRADGTDPMIAMFETMRERYGWAMFRAAFKAAIADGINWDKFGENPSKLRTAYVCAYLQIGAPGDISSILATQVPDFDAQVMKDIVKAHTKWTGLPAGSESRKNLQDAFLKGDYQSVLSAP